MKKKNQLQREKMSNLNLKKKVKPKNHPKRVNKSKKSLKRLKLQNQRKE